MVSIDIAITVSTMIIIKVRKKLMTMKQDAKKVLSTIEITFYHINKQILKILLVKYIHNSWLCDLMQ